MEERRNIHPQGADHSRKRRKVRPGHVAGGVVMTVFTLVLIGVCTTLMLLGIFMKYVNTSLLPTLEVRAEDYTMSQSSVVYYQDKESGQWVEFQKVHGQENRVLIDIDDMSPYLWQAAVSIEDERFFQSPRRGLEADPGRYAADPHRQQRQLRRLHHHPADAEKHDR